MPFRTALSGLNAASADLRVIGHNVANASTTGFKKSRAEFADIFAASNLGTTANAIGAGVRIASVAQQFTQGNISFTDNNLDLAISGQGFFRMNDNGITVFSRAGSFGVDREGYVVNSSGQRLTAFEADTAGNITGAMNDLRLDTSDIAPRATESVDIGINLDASDDVPAAPVASTILTTVGTLDSGAAVGASYTTGNTTVFDSFGGTHNSAIRFDKTAANSWNATLLVDGTPDLASTTAVTFNSVTGAVSTVGGVAVGTSPSIDFPEHTISGGATAGATFTLSADISSGFSEAAANSVAVTENGAGAAQGVFDNTDSATYNSSTSLTVYDTLGSPHLATMYFRKAGIPNDWETYTFIDGAQVSADTLTFSTTGTLTRINGAPTPPASINTPTFAPAGGAAPMSVEMNLSNLSQYGSPFSVNSLIQDGYTTGRMSGVDIADSGVITARFTNGQSRTLGQIALANFSNPQGMRQLGDTTWAETYESGAPLVGAPGSGSLGLIQSGALEGSNVDLTEQLVGMITAQRNFQANAQVITTADTITQTIINIR